MLFSLLIAHYNNWHYFQECYKYILNQEYQNIEIIIVDDCSTDNSFQHLKNLAEKDNRIKLFKNEQNKGVGYTKRKCIDLASGEICGFLDPDDGITMDAVSLSVLMHLSDSELVATYSQIMLCDDKLIPQKVYGRTSKIKNKDSLFFNINNEVSHFFTFKKKAYLKTEGIDSNLTSSVDFDLYLKLYEIGAFHFIKKPLYYYRKNAMGVSQNEEKKNILKQNWNTVLFNTCKRRNISKLYGFHLEQNLNFSEIIFKNQNTIIKRIFRKFYNSFQ